MKPRRTPTAPVTDTAADGCYHGPHVCCVCGRRLEGEAWGTVLPLATGDWGHEGCHRRAWK